MIHLAVQNRVSLESGQRAQITVASPSSTSRTGQGPYTIFVAEQGERLGDINLLVYYCETLEEFERLMAARYQPIAAADNAEDAEEWPDVVGATPDET